MRLIFALIAIGGLFNGKDLSGWKLRDEKADPTWKVVSAVKVDPGNPKSSRKDFYNPNIMREFDKTYTLRK